MSKIISSKDLPSYGICLNDRHLRRLEDAGQFPKRVPLTARTYGYVRAEIISYQDEKIAQRDGKAA